MPLNEPLVIDTELPPGAHLDEYFGVWSILEAPFRAAVDQLRATGLAAHLRSPEAQAAQAAAASGSSYGLVESGVAVIELNGPLMKHVSSMDGGSSTVLARRKIRAAARDERVTGILLKIDSPGGTVAGTKDLADEVAEAGKSKPVWTYFEDLGASAAYWVGCQAEKCFAGPTAIVGSIGTFMVVYDFSEWAKAEGVKVHVIRAGEFKGAGTPGTEITDAQLAEWQRVVGELNDHFLKAVGTGRKLTATQVRELADGRVHVGAAAKSLGLIDGVQSFETTLNQLSRHRRPKAMSQSQAQDSATAQLATVGTVLSATLSDPAASYQDLVAGCVGADEKFICSQLAKKATLEQATAAWMAELNDRLQASQKAAAEASEKAEAAAKKPGVDPVVSSATNDGAGAEANADACEQWEAKVEAKIAAGMSRPRAVAAVAKAHPDLHKAMLVTHNTERGRGKAAAKLLEE